MFLCRIKFEVEKGGFYTMTVATYEVENNFNIREEDTKLRRSIKFNVLGFKNRCTQKGVDQRSEVIGMLSSEVFAMSTSDEMGNYLTELEALIREDKLSETTKKMVEECRKEYDRNKKFHKLNMRLM